MKRGRPPLVVDDASVTVSFRLPSKQYDLTQQRANQAQLELADWYRRVVERACRPKPKAGRRS